MVTIESLHVYGAYMSHEKGRIWEKLAGEYLESFGWQILVYNYTIREGELDLIALRQGELIFVEVKMRSADEESIFDSINARKRKALIRAAEAFMSEFDQDFDTCYFLLLYYVDGVWNWLESPFDSEL